MSGGANNLVSQPLNIPGIDSPLPMKIKGAVVEIKPLIQPEPSIQHKAAYESRREIAFGFQQSSQCHGIRAEPLAIVPEPIREGIGGSE